MTTDEYITMQDYTRKHAWPPIGGLRHLMRNAETNGLAERKAFVRVGRRVLINERVFLNWIGSQIDGNKND